MVLGEKALLEEALVRSPRMCSPITRGLMPARQYSEAIGPPLAKTLAHKRPPLCACVITDE